MQNDLRYTKKQDIRSFDAVGVRTPAKNAQSRAFSLNAASAY
jgi:hypothetical protein